MRSVAPVSGVFPVDAHLRLLEIGIQAIQLSPYRSGSRNASSHTPGHDRCFPGRLRSPITVSDQGKPSDPGTSGLDDAAPGRTAWPIPRGTLPPGDAPVVDRLRRKELRPEIGTKESAWLRPSAVAAFWPPARAPPLACLCPASPPMPAAPQPPAWDLDLTPRCSTVARRSPPSPSTPPGSG